MPNHGVVRVHALCRNDSRSLKEDEDAYLGAGIFIAR
jgi:hypothetical protein